MFLGQKNKLSTEEEKNQPALVGSMQLQKSVEWRINVDKLLSEKD